MRLHGIGVSPGSAHGPAVLINTTLIAPPGARSTDPEATLHTIGEGLESVAQEMESRLDTAAASSRPVLEATAMMARDPGLISAAEPHAAEGHGPVDALHLAIEEYCGMLASLGDSYLAERQSDLRDIFQRAAAAMLGLPVPGIPSLHVPSVIIAHDLSPADTATLRRDLVLGIITEAGGPTSHTAIIAAQLGIPAVVQAAGVLSDAPGRVGLDGSTGTVITDPTPEAAESLVARDRARIELQADGVGPGATSDGHPVQVLANIGTLDDALLASRADVEGVGLFRTEFLFPDRDQPPSVAEQTEAYTRVFDAFAGRKVVVRTLDAGADKPLAFANLGEEANPALGVRGLRLHRELRHLLDDQLEALAAAQRSTSADVWVMAPMVATPSEASWFAALGRAAGLPTVGTMIEIPAAALRSGQVLADCDFASIGTNDLSQYLFAADRMDGRLAPLLSGWQPALWSTIRACVSGAAGKPVGICGEIAGDPLLALVATGAGISSLSMATARTGLVRAALRRHDLATCTAMLQAVLDADSPEEARSAVVTLADRELALVLG